MKIPCWKYLPALLLLAGVATAGEVALDLSGDWGFCLDPENVGLGEGWHEGEFAGSLKLPGCLQEQGYGNIPGPDTIWWDGKQLKPYPWALEYHREGNFKIQSFLLPFLLA